jgi:hypothetical protein
MKSAAEMVSLLLAPKNSGIFFLLNPKVEIGRSITTWCPFCGGRASGVAGVIVVPVEVDVGIIIVVIIFRGKVDIVTSSSGHLVWCLCGKLFILLF